MEKPIEHDLVIVILSWSADGGCPTMFISFCVRAAISTRGMLKIWTLE